MYVKSRESVTAMVNMCTKVEIEQIYEKTSMARTAKRMDNPRKNVPERISAGKNAHSFTRTVTKKRS